MSITAAVRIDVELSGPGNGWTQLEDVLLQSGIKGTRGIRGSGPADRVASVGTLSFELDNSERNSTETIGYYSIGHASALAGWTLGIGVRFVLVYEEITRIFWRGFVDSVVAVPGTSRERRARVNCVDWMDAAAKAKPSGLEVLIDVASHEVWTALLDSVSPAPPATYIGSGSDVYPFANDNVQDESSTILGLGQRLQQSELGQIYVADDGLVVFEGRRRRAQRATPHFVFGGDKTVAIDVSSSRADVLNRIQVQVHPRRRDSAATTVLFTLPTKPLIKAGTSYAFNAPYKDPEQPAQRVAGVDMVTPVSSTDYSFNAAQDGSGADLTTNLTVTVTFGGNSAAVLVENGGPDGYLTFRLRGRGLYDFSPVVVEAIDEDSQEDVGANILGFDMPYQSDVDAAQDAALYFLALNKDVKTRARALTYIASASDELMRQALTREISDLITVQEPVTGIDANHFINSITFDLDDEGILAVTYDLEIADSSQPWLLEIPGRTELDETTILGFGLFVPGWALGESVLGTDTYVN